MKKTGLVLLIILAITFYLLETNPAARSGKINISDGVERKDTLIAGAATEKLASLDTADFIKRVMHIGHDSIAKNWPILSVYPEPGAVLPFRRIVALYGNFYSPNMGILGKLPEEELINLLNKESKLWVEADTLMPVIPAIHYIAITAQNQPGKGGNYRLRMPDDQIEKAISLGEKVNGITFLDVQVGQSTVQNEVPTLEKYLLNPKVHLGLDPEWSMKDGSVPATKIGSLDAEDINFAIRYLSDLVKNNNLPPQNPGGPQVYQSDDYKP